MSHDDGSTWEIIDEGTPVLEFDFQTPRSAMPRSINPTTPRRLSTQVCRRYAHGYIRAIIRHGVFGKPEPDGRPGAGKLTGKVPDDFLLSVSDAWGWVDAGEMIENNGDFSKEVDLKGLPAGMFVHD